MTTTSGTRHGAAGGPTPKVPVDAAARNKAATDLSVSMTLNAGAGSGKTSVLTARIVALLQTGKVEPRELAAITFTEKAAGELLSRVRDALEGAIQNALREQNTEASARLSRALERFGEITLTTIHSFCRDLLRHESLEAKFAPDTDVGDERSAGELLRRAVRSWLVDLRVRRPELWRVIEQLVTTTALVKACENLYRYRDYQSVVCDEPFDAAVAFGELKGLVPAIEQGEQCCKCPDDDVLIKRNRRFVDCVRSAAASARALDGVLDVLLSEAKTTTSGGKALDWGGPANKEAYGAAVEAVARWRHRMLERVHGEVLRELRAHLIVRFDEEKRAQSIATFDDLLREAAELLRKNPTARARLSARYRAVLVDEVQDTDPVQAEVATLLTRNAAEETHWHASDPEPGRLFAVGDPKQSIYRFRGADVLTFQRIEQIVKKNGHGATLAQNFRSVPGVVSWVNHVFKELPAFDVQVAQRDPASLDPVVLLQASKDVPEVEATLRHLHALFTSCASVVDRDSGVLRPAEARDVMIILPTWTKADAIGDKLRSSGIECVVEGGDTFFLRDEVRLGVCALRALVEPSDTEAVVFILRGLFGLSLVELAEHKKQNGSFRYTVPNAPPGKVASALSVLSKLHRGRASKGLAGLLDELFEEANVLAVWTLLPDGASRLANIDKLKSMVRTIEGTTASPLAVVDELLRSEADVADKDIDRIDDDGNALRITSLFKAKGLESPIVVLVEAHRVSKSQPCIVDHEKATVALKLGELVPPGWEGLEEIEAEHQAQERRRWTYVQATRARDQLVICRPAKMNKKPNKEQLKGGGEGTRKFRAGCLLGVDIEPRGLPDIDGLKHGELVSVTKTKDGPFVRVLLADELAVVVKPLQSFPGLDDKVDALLLNGEGEGEKTGDPEGEKRAVEMKDRVKAAKRRCVRWRSATSDAGGSSKWTPGVPVEEGVAEESVGARGGRVVHAVMERLDLSKAEALLIPEGALLAEVLARQAGLPDDKVEACQRIVERILKNPLIEKARNAPERWHEVPFTYEKRPLSVVSGTIDLCFPVDPERKKWIVFDWKSKVPPKDSKLHEKYREQLKMYAEALLKTLGDVQVIGTEIVGPHVELGVVGGPEDVLGDVRGDWKVRLAEFIELRGPDAAAPKIGFDVGEPAVSVEVYFDDKQVVIDPDLTEEQRAALVVQGFKVFSSLGDDVVAALGIVQPAAEDS